MFYNDWFDLSVTLIISKDINVDFLQILSLIIEEKLFMKQNNQILNNNLIENMSFMLLIQLLNKFNSSFLIKDSTSNLIKTKTPVFFIDFCFETVYFNCLAVSFNECIDSIHHINQNELKVFLNYFKSRLICFKKTHLKIINNYQNLAKFYGQQNLNFWVKIFINLSKKVQILIRNMENQTIQECILEEPIKLIENLKTATIILCEILTFSEHIITKQLSDSNIKIAQDDAELFDETCFLIREASEITDKMSVLDQNSKINFKSELLSLIGILVFNNNTNQIKLVENNVFDILSKSFNIDTDNMLVREWSIISLKHVLDCNDYK